ncbi:hypothetical protein PoB_001578800 [Plakobranchus ocellatus]|uniref:Uncharacterized protein n=1 Tax=Plakobranchus ocellatus TaxID=259542 RepID=A0AAV3Z3G0_9GAST|nr:hypothetical protein PoB_001578800 [Plakobranchus ocellatus]
MDEEIQDLDVKFSYEYSVTYGNGSTSSCRVIVRNYRRPKQRSPISTGPRGEISSAKTTKCLSLYLPNSTWEEKEVEDSRRRSRRDDSARKEVGIEDKSQAEKEMSPCPDERQSIGDNLPWSPLTTRGNHGGAYSSPGPTRGKMHVRGMNVDYVNDLLIHTPILYDYVKTLRELSGSFSRQILP